MHQGAPQSMKMEHSSGMLGEPPELPRSRGYAGAACPQESLTRASLQQHQLSPLRGARRGELSTR